VAGGDGSGVGGTAAGDGVALGVAVATGVCTPVGLVARTGTCVGVAADVRIGEGLVAAGLGANFTAAGGAAGAPVCDWHPASGSTTSSPIGTIRRATLMAPSLVVPPSIIGTFRVLVLARRGALA
jgi:hypothetical protein